MWLRLSVEMRLRHQPGNAAMNRIARRAGGHHAEQAGPPRRVPLDEAQGVGPFSFVRASAVVGCRTPRSAPIGPEFGPNSDKRNRRARVATVDATRRRRMRGDRDVPDVSPIELFVMAFEPVSCLCRDPFESASPCVLAWLEAEPDRIGRELFLRLQDELPCVLPDGQLTFNVRPGSGGTSPRGNSS